MTIKKSTLLASAIALASAVYLPSAAAVSSDTFTANVTNGTETFYFGVGSGPTLEDGSGNTVNAWLDTLSTGASYAITIDVVYPGPSAAETFDVSLESTSFTGDVVTFNGNPVTSVPVGDFNVFPSSAVLGSSGTYPIVISGTLNNPQTGVSGLISITPTSGTPISGVPEPEQWAMLLLGLPVISWFVRRKQAA